MLLLWHIDSFETFAVTIRILLQDLNCKHVSLYKRTKTYHLLEHCNAKSQISAIC